MTDTISPKSRGLGRGLNALFEDDEDSGFASAVMAESAGAVSAAPSKTAQTLGVEQLSPGAVQPRMDFDQESLQQLADSIQVHGILQPILVRQKRDLITKDAISDQYEIIAGERRWRAAQLAQLHDVPVIIRELDDAQAMQIALIENLQREDLNPVEEALAYQRLMDEHDYTQQQLAEVLGRSRSHIANMTRMLGLPEAVLEMVRHGDLTPGHARALITMDNPKPLAEKIIAEKMSVRAVENYINNMNKKIQNAQGDGQSGLRSPDGKLTVQVKAKDADTLNMEHDLSGHLGMRLSIETKKPSDFSSGGYVRIDFKSLDQLNDLLDILKGKGPSPVEMLAKQLLD